MNFFIMFTCLTIGHKKKTIKRTSHSSRSNPGQKVPGHTVPGQKVTKNAT